MNKKMIIALIAGLVAGGGIGFGVAKTASTSTVATTGGVALPEISELTDEYLAKIEGYGVSVADYTNNLAQVIQSIPPEQLAQLQANEAAFKAEILETLINQVVVTAQANEEGFLENPENARLFRALSQQALFNLYLTKNMPADTNAFAPSKAELDQAFNQYGRELINRGLNTTQVREYLSAQLVQQKRQRWMFDFVNKIREQFRIERNSKIIEEQGISATGFGGTDPQNP